MNKDTIDILKKEEYYQLNNEFTELKENIEEALAKPFKIGVNTERIHLIEKLEYFPSVRIINGHNTDFRLGLWKNTVVAIDSYIYIIGGCMSDSTSVLNASDSIYKYDTINNTYTLLSCKLPQKLLYVTASAIGSDIYIVGGRISEDISTEIKKVLKFDTITETITETNIDVNIPTANYKAVTYKGYIYSIGWKLGYDFDGKNSWAVLIQKTDIYKEKMECISYVHTGECSSICLDKNTGNLYFIGGRSNNLVEYQDPGHRSVTSTRTCYINLDTLESVYFNNTWLPESQYYPCPSMVYENNLIYLSKGKVLRLDLNNPIKWETIFITDELKYTPFSSYIVKDENIYFFGGQDSDNTNFNDNVIGINTCYRFDPASLHKFFVMADNNIADIATKAHTIGIAPLRDNNTIFFTSGQTLTGGTGIVFKYNIDTNIFTQTDKSSGTYSMVECGLTASTVTDYIALQIGGLVHNTNLPWNRISFLPMNNPINFTSQIRSFPTNIRNVVLPLFPTENGRRLVIGGINEDDSLSNKITIVQDDGSSAELSTTFPIPIYGAVAIYKDTVIPSDNKSHLFIFGGCSDVNGIHKVSINKAFEIIFDESTATIDNIYELPPAPYSGYGKGIFEIDGWFVMNIGGTISRFNPITHEWVTCIGHWDTTVLNDASQKIFALVNYIPSTGFLYIYGQNRFNQKMQIQRVHKDALFGDVTKLYLVKGNTIITDGEVYNAFWDSLESPYNILYDGIYYVCNKTHYVIK